MLSFGNGVAVGCSWETPGFFFGIISGARNRNGPGRVNTLPGLIDDSMLPPRFPYHGKVNERTKIPVSDREIGVKKSSNYFRDL
jgi:hypothetical protein